MRKNLLILGLVVLLLSMTAVPAIAQKGPKVPPRSRRHGKSGHIILVSKDTDTWIAIWPGAFGLLKYPLESTSGEFKAKLIVHHLKPSSWYLVTLQGPGTDSSTDHKLGDIGYYGVEPKLEDGLGWADVALFQTNEGGNANIIIPAAFPEGIVDPGHDPPGNLNAPTLLDGNYDGVRIVVKFINTGDTPDWGILIGGGTAVLFEHKSFNFTIGESENGENGDGAIEEL